MHALHKNGRKMLIFLDIWSNFMRESLCGNGSRRMPSKAFQMQLGSAFQSQGVVRYAAIAGPHRVRRNALSIMVGAANNKTP
jgi:hypothetical protein